MKWFKHATNAHDGKFVKHIFRKFGLEGEARYWRLVGFLASKFPPDRKGFYTVPLESIRELLRQRSETDCRSFLDHLATYHPPFSDRSVTKELFIVEYSANDCRIKYDKLTEIKDNHTTNLQATSKRLASNLDLDKRKNKNNKKNKTDDNSSPDFSKRSIPEIAAEVTQLVRTFTPGADYANSLREHILNASPEAKKVFSSNSMVSLGNADSFALSAMIKLSTKVVA